MLDRSTSFSFLPFSYFTCPPSLLSSLTWLVLPISFLGSRPFFRRFGAKSAEAICAYESYAPAKGHPAGRSANHLAPVAEIMGVNRWAWRPACMSTKTCSMRAENGSG